MNIVIHKSYLIKAEGTTHIHALKTHVQVFAGLKKAGNNRLGQHTPDGWKEEYSDRKTWLCGQVAYTTCKFEGI